MRRLKSFSCSFALLIALLAPDSGAAQTPKPQTGQTVTLITEEDRTALQAIGRVNVGGYRSRRLCTGTLIADDTVLTAAHCVIDPATLAPFRAGRITFVAGWHKGKHAGASQAREVVINPDYLDAQAAGNPPTSAAAVTADWAVLQLETPLTDLTPFDLAPAQPGPVALLGYRRDRPQALSQYAGCIAQLFVDGPIRLDCPVTGGTSGAPVLQTGLEGQLAVIGVVSATGRTRAFAARLPLDATPFQTLDR